MQIDIPNHEVNDFLMKVYQQILATNLFEKETLKDLAAYVVRPEDWELSLFVPRNGKQKASVVRQAVEKILLEECGVDRSRCEYFGYQKDMMAYEWYLRHPNTPKDICERVDAEFEEEPDGEAESELPIPNGFESKTDTVFMTLKDECFKAIESGEKKVEYRRLNQYYCDKLLSPGVPKKFVKFNRGYKSGKENQMTFEIKDILLVSDKWREIPARNAAGKPIMSYSELPPRFAPAMYGISLGKRVR